MMFEILKGKKKKEDEVPEEFRLPGPPFEKKEPMREFRSEPAPRPYVPPEFGGERFPARPEPKKETDRIELILSKLDIIDARLKIIEEKMK